MYFALEFNSMPGIPKFSDLEFQATTRHIVRIHGFYRRDQMWLTIINSPFLAFASDTEQFDTKFVDYLKGDYVQFKYDGLCRIY